MKIIASTSAAEKNVFYTLPDTALRQGGKPFFVPEDACQGRLLLAARVCRQGRYVGLQFARRYFDSVTCVIAFTKTERLQKLQKAGLPWAEAVGFDDSVCVGKFMPIDSMTTSNDLQLTATVGDEKQHSAGIDFADIDAFVAEASCHFTLHQGDYLLVNPKHEETSFPAQQNIHVEVTLCNHTLLSFNMK